MTKKMIITFVTKRNYLMTLFYVSKGRDNKFYKQIFLSTFLYDQFSKEKDQELFLQQQQKYQIYKMLYSRKFQAHKSNRHTDT